MIAWSPPDGHPVLDGVMLSSPPDKALTPQAYRLALSSRIDRLVAKEPRAAEMLALVDEVEPHDLASNPQTAGEILTEASDLLRSRSAMPRFPVPALKVTHSRDVEARLKEETLEEFVSALLNEPE